MLLTRPVWMNHDLKRLELSPSFIDTLLGSLRLERVEDAGRRAACPRPLRVRCSSPAARMQGAAYSLTSLPLRAWSATNAPHAPCPCDAD